jgi:tetratricopeptide (TPR) repeat protein
MTTRIIKVIQVPPFLQYPKTYVKRMLKDYQGALENLDKADVLEPNNAFTLGNCGNVKKMLKDYQGALEDLDKVYVLEPNHAFTL